MNKVQEALKAAIEALEDIYGLNSTDTIKLCKSALSEVESSSTSISNNAIEKCEPVAYKHEIYINKRCVETWYDDIKNPASDTVITPLYTSPISKEWVGLSDAEALKLWVDLHPDSEQRSNKDYWLAIEAKLKQLNAEKG